MITQPKKQINSTENHIATSALKMNYELSIRKVPGRTYNGLAFVFNLNSCINFIMKWM